MTRTVICLVSVLLFAGAVNAQTRSMIGLVVDRTEGNSGKWVGIDVKVGNKKYFVYTESIDLPTPKIVGKVDEIGRTVQVFYTKIVKGESGYDGELRATKIVEIKTAVRPITPRGASINQDWDTFWNAFRVAVQARDRKALMNMMVRDFRYDCCDNPDTNNNGDTRDEAFRLWDNPKVHGWQRLNTAIAQGAVPEAAWRSAGNGSRNERRVAPSAANRKDFVRYDRIRKEYSGWAAVFELRNGRWYFISFEVPGE